MKTLETRIKINASAEQVWNVLSDFESYPNWNPFVIRIEGSGDVGQQLCTSIKIDDSKPQSFQPIVLKNEKNKEFRWKGKLFIQGLFDGEHYFQLNPISEMETEFIHGEKFMGVLVSPIMSLIGQKTENGFNDMNEALKNRVETLKS